MSSWIRSPIKKSLKYTNYAELKDHPSATLFLTVSVDLRQNLETLLFYVPEMWNSFSTRTNNCDLFQSFRCHLDAHFRKPNNNVYKFSKLPDIVCLLNSSIYEFSNEFFGEYDNVMIITFISVLKMH